MLLAVAPIHKQIRRSAHHDLALCCPFHTQLPPSPRPGTQLFYRYFSNKHSWRFARQHLPLPSIKGKEEEEEEEEANAVNEEDPERDREEEEGGGKFIQS